jgi:hypothetical protein
MATLSLPTGISTTNLQWWIQDNRARIAFLESLMERFEDIYGCTLAELEARLARGEGQEHPDWEDSIEWRNAVEQHRQLQLQEELFVWLSRLDEQSVAS